jgi:hypothetical protein
MLSLFDLVRRFRFKKTGKRCQNCFWLRRLHHIFSPDEIICARDNRPGVYNDYPVETHDPYVGAGCFYWVKRSENQPEILDLAGNPVDFLGV